MKATAVLAALEQSCQERGIKLIYDDLQTEGGLCRLRENYYIIINRRASTETRVRILRDSLGRMAGPIPFSIYSFGSPRFEVFSDFCWADSTDDTAVEPLSSPGTDSTVTSPPRILSILSSASS